MATEFTGENIWSLTYGIREALQDFTGSSGFVTTATLSNVESSSSNVTLVAENTSRIGLLIFNDSTSTLYVKYGATATASSYSVKMEPGSYWEMPKPMYRGIIDGIWSAANGNARITEMV